jgi:hypothetical protein
MMKTFLATLAAVLFMGSFAISSEGEATTPARRKATSEADVLVEAAKYDMSCDEVRAPSVTRFVVQNTPYFIVTCVIGAYNENSILLREDTFGGILRPVSIVVPVVNSQGKIVGFTSEIVTPLMTFDPKSNQLTTFSLGSSKGDTFRTGKYLVSERQVVLREYTIDDVEGDAVVVEPIFKSTQPIN